MVSPDSRFLYAAGRDDATIARFNRDPGNGAIAYRGCITGSRRTGPSGSRACALIPNATRDGNSSPLSFVASLALSPDGRSLFTGGTSVARFGRDPTSGLLSYRDCITGSKRSGPSGSGA